MSGVGDVSGLAGMTPAQRAHVIYTEARTEMSSRLWEAALGSDAKAPADRNEDAMHPRSLDALLNLLQGKTDGATPTMPYGIPAPIAAAVEQQRGNASCGNASDENPFEDAPDGEEASEGGRELDMAGGPNARYAPMLQAASARTGLPAAALATIVHAEAAKGSDGRWLAYSRNPRSSAAGLGQFLNTTWIGEAERAGTWLHETAAQRGWLDTNGRVSRADRSELLALRYDARASIEATADYARANLDALQRAGVKISNNVDDIARTAYLGHHLGRGDAIRFMTGQLAPQRARLLLDAQIGRVESERRIAAAGGAVEAHRSWLLGYVNRNIQPATFSV